MRLLKRVSTGPDRSARIDRALLKFLHVAAQAEQRVKHGNHRLG
jgi:hypothetical protein